MSLTVQHGRHLAESLRILRYDLDEVLEEIATTWVYVRFAPCRAKVNAYEA